MSPAVTLTIPVCFAYPPPESKIRYATHLLHPRYVPHLADREVDPIHLQWL
jgi:hypothetical protein